MVSYRLPKRVFIGGKRRMLSVRLPDALIKRLGALAKDSGWSMTDVIQTALDVYSQKVSKKSKSR